MVSSSCIAILFLFLVTIYEFLFEFRNVSMIEALKLLICRAALLKILCFANSKNAHVGAKVLEWSTKGKESSSLVSHSFSLGTKIADMSLQ